MDNQSVQPVTTEGSNMATATPEETTKSPINSPPATPKPEAKEAKEAKEVKQETKRPEKGAEAAQRRQRTRQQYSIPFVENTLTLKSFHTQQTFERGFQQGAEALFTLSVVMRVVASEEQAIQVEEIVNLEFKTIFDEMRAEFVRLDLLADANGISSSGLKYSLPKDYEPQITSPRAARYLQLIRDLDRLIETMDALWLSHVISDSELSKGVFKWKRRILRLSGTLRTLAIRGMGSAQRKDVDQIQDPRSGTALDPDASKASEQPAPADTANEDQTPASADVQEMAQAA